MTQGTDANPAATSLGANGSRERVATADRDLKQDGELRAVSAEQTRLAREPEPDPPASHDEELHVRLDRLERQNFRMKLALVLLVMVVGYLGFEQVVTESTIIKQTLMESRELKLLDNKGNARLFLRMYSRVPVLQLLDTSGKPRLSLGMRFDDTPFIDLSDRTGRTRATLELTEKDEPALRMFDENGEPTFNIN